MELLSRKEEIILLSIQRLGNEAYGIKIREDIKDVTGVSWPFGSIYTPISNLDEKGFIRSHKGEATGVRGGKAKIYFELTKSGLESLEKIKALHENLWKNVPPLKAD